MGLFKPIWESKNPDKISVYFIENDMQFHLNEQQKKR